MKLLTPEIFTGLPHIEAVFTPANKNSYKSAESIPGLNLGNNTNTSPQKIKENFSDLFQYLNWNKDKRAGALQVHGDNIEIIDEPGVYPDTDGLITQKKGLILSIQVADCAAVLVANSANATIGAFHAGWKGASKGIIRKGIRLMQSLDQSKGTYKAFISPCISVKHFEVGEEVAQIFPNHVVDRHSYKKPHVDLEAFIIDELISQGITKQNIQSPGICTYENEDYYSYRREREKAGRMLAMIKHK